MYAALDTLLCAAVVGFNLWIGCLVHIPIDPSIIDVFAPSDFGNELGSSFPEAKIYPNSTIQMESNDTIKIRGAVKFVRHTTPYLVKTHLKVVRSGLKCPASAQKRNRCLPVTRPLLPNRLRTLLLLSQTSMRLLLHVNPTKALSTLIAQ
jgi:hypothetical protein